MNRTDWQNLFNLRVVIGAVVIAGLLLLLTLALLGWMRPASRLDLGFAPAQLTVIPAPSSTPNLAVTASLDPLLAGTPTLKPDEIGVGGYVQIAGTEGEGLRLRASPGLTGAPVFLGYDDEVFEVRDGPQDADGYTWWYLVAPYDETRAGWAAADFLSPIPSP
ncbi:MAG: hypothetical protein Fur0043_13800 [Anaerolineales bacterium]